MKLIDSRILAFNIGFALIAFATANAQQVRMFSPDNAFILRETGTVIVANDGKMLVEMPGAPDKKSEFLSGDEVAMAQKKRVKSLKDLQDLYKETPHGADFKLGVRRNGQLVIIGVVRDTANSGRQMVMRMGAGGPGGGTFTSAGGQTRVITSDSTGSGASGGRRMVIQGGAEDVFVAGDFGLVFGLKEGKIRVVGLVDVLSVKGKEAGFQQHDVLKSINKVEIKTMAQVRDLVPNRTGALEFEIERGGKTFTLTLK